MFLDIVENRDQINNDEATSITIMPLSKKTSNFKQLEPCFFVTQSKKENQKTRKKNKRLHLREVDSTSINQKIIKETRSRIIHRSPTRRTQSSMFGQKIRASITFPKRMRDLNDQIPSHNILNTLNVGCILVPIKAPEKQKQGRWHGENLSRIEGYDTRSSKQK